jgi:hypothetical protein
MLVSWMRELKGGDEREVLVRILYVTFSVLHHQGITG